MPEITPLRDASWGFGLWPWSKGPLWRIEENWTFTVMNSGTSEVTHTIPAGYEFDKASVPSFLWGFPFNYTPDGLCTVPALEHDFLCDLFRGGSDWLKKRLGTVPAAPAAAVIHRHFYDQLLAWGVRASKARAMWEGVRNFGPGGRAWPGNWFGGRTAVFALLWLVLLSGCTRDLAGFSRQERLQLYALGATLAGHPEAGAALGVLARAVGKNPRPVLPAAAGKPAAP